MSRHTEKTPKLPLRPLVIFLFLTAGGIAAATGISFLQFRQHLPDWFIPVFFGVIGVFLLIVLFFSWQALHRRGGREAVRWWESLLIWFLLIVSVPCTSSLHKFYPFWRYFWAYWPKGEGTAMLRYNYILTAASFLCVLIFCVLHLFRRKQWALIGLILLAAVMLVPNDNCPNDFNRPWNYWIGASPLMYMPNSVLILIGCAGLCGIRPRAGIACMLLINLSVLALGISHITGVLW